MAPVPQERLQALRFTPLAPAAGAFPIVVGSKTSLSESPATAARSLFRLFMEGARGGEQSGRGLWQIFQ